MRLLRLAFSSGILGLTLTGLLLASSLCEVAPLRALESRILDRLLLAGKDRPAHHVALVAIDDASIEQLGSWPWPRTMIADVLGRVVSSEARAVGLHLFHAGPELNPGLEELRTLRDRLPSGEGDLKGLLAGVERRLDGDRALAAAISRGRVALPVRAPLEGPSSTRSRNEPYLQSGLAQLPHLRSDWKKRLLELRNPLDSLQTGIPPSVRFLPPAQEFAARAAGLGHVVVLPDGDGVVRTQALFLPWEDTPLPSLALRLAALGTGVEIAPWPSVDAESFPDGVRLGERTVPTDEAFRMLLDFRQDVRRYSFADVARGAVPPEAFQDRIVLVGLTARDHANRYPVPTGNRLSAVELSALATENLLSDSHLSRPSWAWVLEAGVVLYLGLFLSLVVPRVSLRIGGAMMAGFLLAWVGTAIFLALSHGVWLKAGAPGLLVGVGFGLVAVRRLAAAGAGTQETTELNKMLGLAFQGQGQLDLAFEKFVRCPLRDPSVRDLLYNLGLDFERKRMANKAVTVYRHILAAGKFKDVEERIGRLEDADRTVVLGTGASRSEATLVLDPDGTQPTLGRYEIVRELGQGAMGTVYLGRDPKIQREVAIKTLRYAEVDEDQLREVKRRFFREAEAAGKLNHPGIVTIYDVGEDHDLAYLAMEYLEGTTLADHCRKDNLLPVPEALGVVSEVADALAYAHRRGVVHRDIKPANIMRLPDGTVKVTDFGIARVLDTSSTQTGMVLGTPTYMSPEQVAGRKVDGRSDIFSLGVVCYELLCGERPFQGESMAALMYNITKGTYTPLAEMRRGLPKGCAAVVERMLTRAVSRRVRSAAEVAEELRTCQSRGR